MSIKDTGRPQAPPARRLSATRKAASEIATR